ncbi:hypothetical protein [Nocardia sp. NPDC005998]|uniref:hypothetical protein n=1 Tax=Nocardia sp. NPDC005998 TaxID=3156894 RepID=UPI0033A5F9D9
MSRLWTVHWVSAELVAPPGRHPLLDEWRDLVEREESFGPDPGDPFMVDPDFRVDARLTRYFGRSSFANLRKTTKRSYTTNYRVFFNFLWGLAQLDPPPQSIADITPAVWSQWRISRPQKPLRQRQIRKIAALLKHDDQLPEATRDPGSRSLPGAHSNGSWPVSIRPPAEGSIGSRGRR